MVSRLEEHNLLRSSGRLSKAQHARSFLVGRPIISHKMPRIGGLDEQSSYAQLASFVAGLMIFHRSPDV
eukprot:scaffold1439_cov282-Pinguiococcus_pyrenoidosus.AAC.2